MNKKLTKEDLILVIDKLKIAIADNKIESGSMNFDYTATRYINPDLVSSTKARIRLDLSILSDKEIDF